MKKIIKCAPVSMAMKYDIIAKEKIQNGEKVYNFAAGDPNLKPCEAIKNSYKNLDLDKTHNYGSSKGFYELRAKINPQNPDNVIVSNGCKQLLTISLLTTCEKGDKVLIIGPAWSSYMAICKALGIEYKMLIGKPDNLYKVEIEDIKMALDSQVSAIYFNNPNNPTGAVYDEKFCKELLKLAKENDTWIISDEIYDKITYNDSFYSLKNNDNVICLNGFSKSYNITGWRLGYAICNEREVVDNMSVIQGQLMGPTNTIIQKIIIDAYDDLEVADLSIYKERINYLADNYEIFAKYKPEGGFYFYIPVSDSEKVCKKLLENNIIVTPGDDYGVKNTLRISISSVTLDDIKSISEVFNGIVVG